MIKRIVTFSVIGLLSAATAGTQLFAQQTGDTAKPAASQKETPKNNVVPFHGKLKSVDKAAGTFTVGNRTFQVTADTKMTRGEKAATLEDAVIGENVGGAYRKSDDGKLTATTVHFGAKETAADSSKAM